MSKNLLGIKQSTLLKAAAVIVAAPRYMGAFGAAVGANIHSDYAFLVTVEVYSGLAMAILEGAAVGYCFGKWREMKKGSLDWWILTILVISLLLLLPLIAGPYLVAMQSGQAVNQVVSPFFLWVWSILISGLPVLIIASVGYADIEIMQLAAKIAKPEPLQLRPKEKQEVKRNASEVQKAQPAQTAKNENDILQPLQDMKKGEAVQFLANLEREGLQFTNAEIAKAANKNPSTTARWKPDIEKIVLNGKGN